LKWIQCPWHGTFLWNYSRYKPNYCATLAFKKIMLIYREFAMVCHDYQIKHVCKQGLGANKHIFKFNTIVNFFGNGFSNTKKYDAFYGQVGNLSTLQPTLCCIIVAHWD
jgi:hypothetical protein